MAYSSLGSYAASLAGLIRESESGWRIHYVLPWCWVTSAEDIVVGKPVCFSVQVEGYEVEEGMRH